MIKSIELFEDRVKILDQTLLPLKEDYVTIRDYRAMIEAIRYLRIRGAPAIGIAGAAAGWLAAVSLDEDKKHKIKLEKMLSEIESARPTAVNLSHAINRLRNAIPAEGRLSAIRAVFRREVESLMDYEETACLRMGEAGADFLGKSVHTVLTHCNTGSLATYGIGTALAVVRTLASRQHLHVYVDETRPLQQGARLTMWELMRDGISCTLQTDNMAAWLLATRKIDCILTGADRIASNGDTANKIGTLNLAILADYFRVPFVIVAPETTIDTRLTEGGKIVIEERNPEEVRRIGDFITSPDMCDVFNPAFDVTPHDLITAIVTDKSVYLPPFRFSSHQ